jgi:hypothetical protein
LSRTLLLARTFFGRLFESDLMPAGMPQAQLVIWSLTFLATPGLLLPVRFAAMFLDGGADSEGIERVLLIFRLLFITLSMTAVGLVALVIWDGMFPDRRDARILGGLPVPGHVLIAGRLLALGALCGIFVVGINAVPTVLFGSMLPIVGGASNVVRGVLAHFLGTTLAGVFVFTALLALQGVVLNLGGRKAADRLSVILQVVFVGALLQMIFFMPRMAGMLAEDLGSGWLRALPSVWFLGLYDVIGGRAVAGAPSLALIAALATLGTVSSAIGIFVLTHGRLTTRAIESHETRARNRVVANVTAALTSTICRQAAARATFEFTMRTLARSRSHRLLLAMYVGIAVAFVGSAIVPLAFGSGFAGFIKPGVEVLSAPLVISFFTLIGARVALSIPVEPKARWAIMLREPANRGKVLDGVRAALIVVGVVPSVVLAGISAAVLWGPAAAWVHIAVCALMGTLLAEILLINLAKFPFTCTYYPGRSRIGTLWPLYITAFGMYAYTAARFEVMLLETGSRRPLAWFAGITIGATLFLTWRRHRKLAALEKLRFEEEALDTIFGGFNLSEGFAAGSAESRQLR